jgi:phosphomannomutase
VKQLIIFDLDGTLAESKAPLDAETAALLLDLLAIVKVAIISGGDWPQFERQLLANIRTDRRLASLFLLPTCGTKYFEYDGAWAKVYSEDLTADERQKIIAALNLALDATALRPETTWGEIIEDRGSQITLSALGQLAPLEWKSTWDPDFAKRKAITAVLDKLIPEFSIRMGGATSIDVTRPGIDKAYGIRKLRDRLGISLDAMMFVGDAIFVGGNDYPAKEAGVACVAVRFPSETKRVIAAIIACLS